jgi:hypothetical protein
MERAGHLGRHMKMKREPQEFFTAMYWQQRADNARRIAQMLEAQARELMLDVARDYERLAQRAEASPTGRSLLAEDSNSPGKDI